MVHGDQDGQVCIRRVCLSWTILCIEVDIRGMWLATHSKLALDGEAARIADT